MLVHLTASIHMDHLPSLARQIEQWGGEMDIKSTSPSKPKDNNNTRKIPKRMTPENRDNIKKYRRVHPNCTIASIARKFNYTDGCIVKAIEGGYDE